MSRGALQGGRELRLRVRHKKPKRLLRSWYNLLGQDQGSVNGSDEPEEVQKDTKHRANHHESKEMACKQLPTSAPPAAGAEHLYSGRTRLNGSSNHGAALLDKILNGRCHSQPEPSAGKDVAPTFEDEEDDEIEQDSDLVCSVCNGGQSDPPNEIVICDTCNKEKCKELQKWCSSTNVQAWFPLQYEVFAVGFSAQGKHTKLLLLLRRPGSVE